MISRPGGLNLSNEWQSNWFEGIPLISNRPAASRVTLINDSSIECRLVDKSVSLASLPKNGWTSAAISRPTSIRFYDFYASVQSLISDTLTINYSKFNDTSFM